MITVITTQIRCDLQHKFYIDTVPAICALFENLLVTSTNILSSSFDLSSDGFTHTSTATFADQSMLDAFLSEMSLIAPTFFEDRDSYCGFTGTVLSRIVS